MRWRRRLLRRQRKTVAATRPRFNASDQRYGEHPTISFDHPRQTVIIGNISDIAARGFAQKHDIAVERMLERVDVEAALAPKRPKPGGSGRVR